MSHILVQVYFIVFFLFLFHNYLSLSQTVLCAACIPSAFRMGGCDDCIVELCFTCIGAAKHTIQASIQKGNILQICKLGI